MGVFSSKEKKGRRNKSEWEDLDYRTLTRLMANRVARIEILKIEIEELKKLIVQKTK